MKTRHRSQFVPLSAGLGFTLALLGLLGSLGPRQGPAFAAAGDVYCVTPGGGSYAACTQVFTHVQAAVDAAAGGEEIRVAAGTYTGVQNVPGLSSDTFTATQVVVITKSLTIRGGYTPADWTTPDPVANPATLHAQGQGRALVISGTITPTVEGLRITGGDATGLGGAIWARDGGGGLYVWEATPTISGCVIYSNTASTANSASGGGVLVRYGAATLSGNTVVSNTASTATRGSGGGLSLRGGHPVLSGNIVVSNTASSASTGYGGGVCVRFGESTLSGNIMVSNRASTSGWGYGGGLFVRRVAATLNGNAVQGNVAGTGPNGSGGGLYLELSDATLTNNLVAANQANAQGSGLWFGGASGDPMSGSLLHNTIAHNAAGDGTGVGMYVGEYATLALTNTIIAGHHGVGMTVTAGSTVTLEATLWHDNGVNTGGAGSISTGAVTVFGDPGFVDPAAWDYHLAPGSAAIDRGLDAGVTTDLDGRPRPLGRPDLGAYESGTRVHLPMLLRRYGRHQERQPARKERGI